MSTENKTSLIIEKDKVVRFHYTLSEVGGSEIESSNEAEPMIYLHGHNNILTALEKAMTGKSVGDEFTVDIPPEDAYGHREEDATQRVPIKHLLTTGKLRPGMLVKVNTQDGAVSAKVIKVGRFNVDLDTNHPLAGLSLSFKINITEIRDAEPEEIAHGHAHGPGGHHH